MPPRIWHAERARSFSNVHFLQAIGRGAVLAAQEAAPVALPGVRCPQTTVPAWIGSAAPAGSAAWGACAEEDGSAEGPPLSSAAAFA